MKKIDIKNLSLPHDNKIETLGRFGYAARATVYGLVGLFALLLSFHKGGDLTDSRGILQHVTEFPYGKIVLGVIGLGLFFFAFWRLMQAIRDYEQKGKTPKGIAVRAGYALSGFAYFGLSYNAFNLIFRLSEISKKNGDTQVARTVLHQSFGHFLLGGLALVIIGLGCFQIYIAIKEKFKHGLLFPKSSAWLSAVCKLGISARGIVFCITGWLFLRAAMNFNRSQTGGMMGVWKFLSSLSYGSILIACMAVGLLAFSVYGYTEAIYRRSRT